MSTLDRLLPRLAPYKARFFGAAVSMAFVAATSGAGAYLLKPIVDQIFVSKDAQILSDAVVVIPIIFLIKALATYAQNYLMTYIGQRVTQDIRRELFVHLHSLSMDFFWRRRSGEVLSRTTNDLAQLQSALQFLPLYIIRDLLTVVVLVGVLFYLNAGFAVFAVLGLPFAGLILWALGRKMRSSSAQAQALMGSLSHRFQESLQGMLVIKAFHFEEGAIGHFDRDNGRLLDQMMRYLRATALAGPIMEFLGALIMTAILYFAGRQILAGTLTPGAFFAFVACFFAAYAPTKNLARSNSELQRGLAAADRVFELLDEKPSVDEGSKGRSCSGIQRALELKNVSFRYPEREAWALKGVSLTIEAGQVVGLVGPSGSGKSTLAHLLLRLFDPASGELLLDGEPLSSYSTPSLRSRIGLVTQETILFHDSIAANVALGRPGATQAQIEDACRLADADEFIRRLPQGYETVAGDRGVKLSGGQRQRLAIARALVKDPAILLLDEATSNLDSASEEAIQRSLEKVMPGRTVILIAHRLSTVQNADKIVVLSQGAVTETGTHRELLAAEGLYAKLYQMQAQGQEA